MKRLAIVAVLLAVTACAPAPKAPADPTEARAALTLMTFGTQTAAIQCTSNARHLARFDEARADALVNACVNALIPARDAVVFSLAGADPWTTKSSAAFGCTAKSVRLGLENVQAAFVRFGYTGPLPETMNDAIRLGRRFEGYALESCDPIHPSTTIATFVDPNIANVQPEYPADVR